MPLTTDSDPWHILGAGALGSLFAAALDVAGKPPVLVLRDQALCASLEAAGGLHLHTPEGDHRQLALPGTHPAAQGEIQRLVVTTKAPQVLPALQSLSPRLSARALVVLLHNGWGPQPEVAQRWPRWCLYAGTTTEGAYRNGPWQRVHAGRGETWLGPVNEVARQAGAGALVDLLSSWPNTGYDADIHRRLWQKLAVNAAINGLTVVYACRNGALLDGGEREARLAALCRETEQLSAALERPLFEEPLALVVRRIASATAANYSSMLQDVQQGRATEVEAINGTLCREARLLGMSLPGHEALRAEVMTTSGRETFR